MLQPIYTLVEQAINGLGVDAAQTRGENEGQWNLSKGSINIMIDVWEEQNTELFQVLAPVCEVPETNAEAFFKTLLEHNHGFSAIAFSIQEGVVYLKHTREAAELSEKEILNLLTKTAYYAELTEKLFSEG